MGQMRGDEEEHFGCGLDGVVWVEFCEGLFGGTGVGDIGEDAVGDLVC